VGIPALEAFISRFKDTFYAELARQRIHDLKEQQGAIVVPPPAQAAISSGVDPPRSPKERVALVVGNSKYRNLGRDLKNPVEDAAAMQVTLHRLGFDLIVGQDLALDGFRRKVDEFAAAARNANIALLFYAGHGVQVEGQNYLLPTDFEVTTLA